MTNNMLLQFLSLLLIFFRSYSVPKQPRGLGERWFHLHLQHWVLICLAQWLIYGLMLSLVQLAYTFSWRHTLNPIVGMESEVKLPKVQFSISQETLHPWRKMCSFSKSDFPSLWLANSSSCRWLHRDAYTAEIQCLVGIRITGRASQHEFSDPVPGKSNSAGLCGVSSQLLAHEDTDAAGWGCVPFVALAAAFSGGHHMMF